jgi:hypothetical protein
MEKFNSIMSVFTKTVAKLEKLEDSNIEKKIVIDSKINELEYDSMELRMEAEMANTTAAKIREFYNA